MTSWICPNCTLMNEASRMKCEACGAQKEIIATAVVVENAPPPPPPPVTRPVVLVTRLGTEPVGMDCPHCGHRIVTMTRVYPTSFTHCLAFGCFLVGLWPCCLIPYCVCNDVEHICPNCRAVVGVDHATDR